MGSPAGTWCLIESDPGVFTELISDLGVTGVQVEELYSIDESSLSMLDPIYGLIFLFKWTGEKDTRPSEEYSNVFFAKQVIMNACATQAILSILLNREEISLGEELSQFKEFTRDFDPETRGFAITNSEKMRSVHNSFSRTESLAFDDEKKTGKTEDAFHFISYLPINGHLYELDGLKPGPINLGPCTAGDWTSKVVPTIQERMNRYQQGSSEIRFNLMAVVKDRKVIEEEKLAQMEAQISEIQSKLANGNPQGPESIDELTSLQVFYEMEKRDIEDRIKTEELKRQRYRKENERRKHNFFPLIFQLLNALAEKGQLKPLIEDSKVKSKKSQ